MAFSCRPVADRQKAVQLAADHFGLSDIEESVQEFVSFEDRNFFIRGRLEPGADVSGFVLKVFHHATTEKSAAVVARCEVALHVGKYGFECPVPVKSLDGNLMDFIVLPAHVESETREPEQTCTEDKPQVRRHGLCLLRFVPGVVASEKKERWPKSFLLDLGGYTGHLVKALQVRMVCHSNSISRYSLKVKTARSCVRVVPHVRTHIPCGIHLRTQ